MAKGRPKFRGSKKPLLLDRSVKARAASVKSSRTPLGIRLIQASVFAGTIAVAGAGSAWYFWGNQATQTLALAAQESTGTRAKLDLPGINRAASPAAMTAASQLENAARSITLRPTHRAAYAAGQLARFPWEADTVSHASDLASLNRTSLDVLRTLRDAPTIQWPVDLNIAANPASAAQHAEQLLSLGRVALWSGITAYHQRDHAAAVELWIDALAVSRQIAAYPTAQALAASLELQREVAEATIHLAPSIRMDTAPGAALAGQLRTLTTMLADDEAFTTAARQSCLIQQQVVLAAVDHTTSPDPRLSGWQKLLASKDLAMLPAQKQQAAETLRTLERQLSALSAPTLPAGLATLTAASPQARTLTEKYFTTLTLNRLASVSAATAVYKKDNGGAPLTLTQLTPNYLKRVPLDPLASGGKALGYQSSPIAFAYSVGQNSSDDTNSGTYTTARQSQASLIQPDLLAVLISPQEEQAAIAALQTPETPSIAAPTSTPDPAPPTAVTGMGEPN